MFYYTVIKLITNIHDNLPLRVVGKVEVYTDEAKQELLTEIPFDKIGVNLSLSDCPTDTAENYNNFVDQKALEGINQAEIQAKLEQVKLAKDLGLLQ